MDPLTLVLVVLLLAAIFGGLSVHSLFWVLVVVLVVVLLTGYRGPR